MAQISDYTLDTTPEDSDILLASGTDEVTKSFKLSDLKTFFQAGLSSGASTNNYPETLTLDSSTAVLTIERNGLSDLTATFGTAALKAESFFATASHSHDVDDILSSNDITADYLNVSGNGTSGQYLVSDGDGSFSWVDGITSDTNFYLTTITKNGNDLEFTVTGAPTETVTITLGSAAYSATTDFATSGHTHALSDLTGVGNLATLDKVTATEIKTDAIITSKIKDSQILASKLAVSGNGTSGQVLVSDGDGTFSWSTPSGQNYFLSGITKSSNTLSFAVTGSSTQTFTFGAAAFLDTGTTGSTVALGNHTHVAADITDLGAIATLDEITEDEIAADAVTGAKIADDAIDSEHYTDGSIDLAHLAADSVDGTKIADDSIDSEHYVDGSIDTAHIGDLQVTTGKIASGAITMAKLDDEFKTIATAVTLSSSTTTATNDFSASAVFPITLASDATNTTITYSNTTIGQTKILKVTGSGGTGTVTITGTKLAGTLDQTSSTVNYIQVTAIGASEYIYTISQA